jgi:hypothetical protein
MHSLAGGFEAGFHNGETSGDSTSGVSGIIFGGIQDSFTTQGSARYIRRPRLRSPGWGTAGRVLLSAKTRRRESAPSPLIVRLSPIASCPARGGGAESKQPHSPRPDHPDVRCNFRRPPDLTPSKHNAARAEYDRSAALRLYSWALKSPSRNQSARAVPRFM